MEYHPFENKKKKHRMKCYLGLLMCLGRAVHLCSLTVMQMGFGAEVSGVNCHELSVNVIEQCQIGLILGFSRITTFPTLF